MTGWLAVDEMKNISRIQSFLARTECEEYFPEEF